MFKKNIIVFIFALIGLLLFFYFNVFNEKVEEEVTKIVKSNITVNKTYSGTHNGVSINEILSEKNFEESWINPNDYESIEDYLGEFKSFSGITIDPLNENFSISMKWNDGSITYIPFRLNINLDDFKNDVNKNLAILDIHNAYNKGNIYWWISSSGMNKTLFSDELIHPESLELWKVFSWEVNINKYIKALENIRDLSEPKKHLLAYLHDFIWDYTKANKLRNTFCKKISNCIKNKDLTISGKIVDQDWNWVSGVLIELLNDNSINTFSDSEWNYKFSFKYFPFSHLRFKTSVLWYSNAFKTISFNENNDLIESNFKFNFKIWKVNKIVSINSENSSDFERWKFFVIKDEYSTYYIPRKGLYYESWVNYKWNDLDIYLYFFKKSSNMDDLLENDTFWPVQWYVWNIMKTFWMPYIQFIDKKSWKELFVKSSNPMILQNQIYHMKELYENSDNIYEKLTKEDMKFLFESSEKLWWYPIDYNFIIENKILRWPAWWALDRKAWIWRNVWIRLLDESWLVELPFYSIKDN